MGATGDTVQPRRSQQKLTNKTRKGNPTKKKRRMDVGVGLKVVPRGENGATKRRRKRRIRLRTEPAKVPNQTSDNWHFGVHKGWWRCKGEGGGLKIRKKSLRLYTERRENRTVGGENVQPLGNVKGG